MHPLIAAQRRVFNALHTRGYDTDPATKSDIDADEHGQPYCRYRRLVFNESNRNLVDVNLKLDNPPGLLVLTEGPLRVRSDSGYYATAMAADAHPTTLNYLGEAIFLEHKRMRSLLERQGFTLYRSGETNRVLNLVLARSYVAAHATVHVQVFPWALDYPTVVTKVRYTG